MPYVEFAFYDFIVAELAVQLMLQLKWPTRQSCTTWDKSVALVLGRTYMSRSMTSLYDAVLNEHNVVKLETLSIQPTKVERRS
jgi:hypothetical protein